MNHKSDFQIRECIKCSRLIFHWTEGHKHLVRKHEWRMNGQTLYSNQFNYYK